MERLRVWWGGGRGVLLDSCEDTTVAGDWVVMTGAACEVLWALVSRHGACVETLALPEPTSVLLKAVWKGYGYVVGVVGTE